VHGIVDGMGSALASVPATGGDGTGYAARRRAEADRPYKRPDGQRNRSRRVAIRGADGRARATIRAEPLPAAVVRPVNLCVRS